MRGEELAIEAPARPSGRDGVDGLITTTAAAVRAAGRCWSFLSACADSLHLGHVWCLRSLAIPLGILHLRDLIVYLWDILPCGILAHVLWDACGL